ncbi:hypothetical protein JQS43_06935 [Natronosporangium hydrolyticum]|uniref:Uncharacterized protein n=1 Tax=Natronosporangium hydrolyticum TaxID=2811111 RepID=A0A895YEN3_9ACTN|nr:hypothetical protein [Natronosporangium hydrolyticum]QSB16041.1 hypothetical protein JQS43_06935 [Natronosporangium hydrolyticum]
MVEVLERARSLPEPVAAKLAAARAPDADHAYGRAWQSWLDEQPDGALYRGGDNSGLLAVPGAGPAGSPIGDGFMVLDRLVTDSAKRSAGPAVFTVDEDGEEALREPLATARLALLDAAMALGAPHLVDPADAALLASAGEQLWPTPECSGDGGLRVPAGGVRRQVDRVIM